MARTRRLPLIGLLSGLALLISVGTALAASEYVTGSLNTSGSLVQYSTIRTHAFQGIIDEDIDNLPGNEYLRLGLRNDTNNTQFTLTEQWDVYTLKEFHLSSNGSNIINARKFRINGRMEAGCQFFCDNTWGGLMHF